MTPFEAGVIDTMTKIAASIEDLRRGVRRLGIVRAKIKDPMGFVKKMMSGDKVRMGPREIAAMGGSIATHPSKRAFEAMSKQQQRAVRRTMLTSGIPRQAVREFEAQGQQAKKMLSMMKPGKKPVIMSGKGRMTPSRVFGAMTGTQLTPAGKKGVNVAGIMHEGFERSAMKPGKTMRYGYGHASPEVLAKEHNMLARLTGKGSEETRKAIGKAREISGDSDALNKLLKERFGDRARIAFGEGKKIPKAMRKALRRGPVSKTWERMPPQMFGGG